MTQRIHNLCIVGFGNVARAFVQLLLDKRERLRDEHGIEWRITGIASRRLGWIADAVGLPTGALLSDPSALKATASDVRGWLQQARADVLFETSSLNRQNGEPAATHLRAALESGAHAISANKGPVVFAYRELRELAARQGKRFRFESTVMDGVPIFSLFREGMPAVEVRAYRGILNSTTNVVLAEMENGKALGDAVRKAQELGVAETDPTDDLEGWDAAVKVAALSVVLFGQAIALDSIQREGITGLDAAAVAAARREGRPYKLLCEARREGATVRARVAPQQIAATDPLARVEGTSSAIHFELDILPGLTIFEENPGLTTTAYGLLADFIRAVGME